MKLPKINEVHLPHAIGHIVPTCLIPGLAAPPVLALEPVGLVVAEGGDEPRCCHREEALPKNAVLWHQDR